MTPGPDPRHPDDPGYGDEPPPEYDEPPMPTPEPASVAHRTTSPPKDRRLRVVVDDQDDTEATTWEPIDLGPYLRGEVERPEASLGVARSDGLRLLYPGREHAIIGETESGKSWFALACVAAELNRSNWVLYIHYEESDPISTVERLRLLDVDPTTISARLRFVAPSRPLHEGWLSPLLDPAPTLVIHDGVNEAMALHGAEIGQAEGASLFRRRLITPCIRAGAATLACDHYPKAVAEGGRRGDAYGSVHKGNALDGARFSLENVDPFGRRLRGRSHLYVTKDRPGTLRAHGRPAKNIPGVTFMGTLVADDSEQYGPDFSLRFFAPKEAEDQDADVDAENNVNAELADAVHDVISALPDQTVDSLELLYAEMRKAGHGSRGSAIRAAVADLIVNNRLIEKHGKRGAKGYQALPDPDSTPSQDSSGSEDV